jgi:hypothetical protein
VLLEVGLLVLLDNMDQQVLLDLLAQLARKAYQE